MKNKSKNIFVEIQRDGKGNEFQILYSYRKLVCCIAFDENTGEMLSVTLGKFWDYSITTRKHVYDFLRDFGVDINGKNVAENAIENGSYSNDDFTVEFYYDGGME